MVGEHALLLAIEHLEARVEGAGAQVAEVADALTEIRDRLGEIAARSMVPPSTWRARRRERRRRRVERRSVGREIAVGVGARPLQGWSHQSARELVEAAIVTLLPTYRFAQIYTPEQVRRIASDAAAQIAVWLISDLLILDWHKGVEARLTNALYAEAARAETARAEAARSGVSVYPEYMHPADFNPADVANLAADLAVVLRNGAETDAQVEADELVPGADGGA
jgi:hypothetical protein